MRAFGPYLTRIGVLLLLGTPLAAAANASSQIEHASVFAVGGVGYAGTMSEGEKSLRAVLKQSDAAARLESLLPHASFAGELYILLGLRLRDRAAYKRVMARYAKQDGTVETMRGCTVGRESFRDLVRQIDHGAFDAPIRQPAW
jgi:hypothetical protein